MKRRELITTLMAVAIFSGFVMPATAQQLSASEIAKVLAGNTIEGTWSGTRYRQYFAEDGSTVYLPEEGRRAEGRWRVDPENGIYESWWISTGWTPYAMVDLPEGAYAWVNGDQVEIFEVRDGRQIE